MIEKLIETPYRVLAGVAALLVVLGAVAVTVMAEGSGQQPLPASATGQFSAERALNHLSRFATEPRPLGSPASDRTRDYIADQLQPAGFTTTIQHAVGTRSSTGLATFGRVDNVVATLPGHDPTGTVLLVAHYDSAATGPGASDDGAAVAAMVEVGQLISRQGGLRNDLVLLFTDGEEDGVLGADAFVREHPAAAAGGVVLNWEARGVSGPSLMFETSEHNAALVSLFADAVPHPRGDSSLVEVYKALPNNSDFTALSNAGFTGLNFAYIEGSSYYHTAGDTLANLDRGSLQHHGENMLHLTRALGRADLPSLKSDHDNTYFRVFGVMITYSNTLVWPIALLAVSAVVASGFIARRRRLASVPRMLLAGLSAILPLAIAALLGQLMWSVLVWLRPGYDLMGGLVHRPLPFQGALVALAGTALLGWYLLLRRRLGPAALAIGALMWPAGVGVACAALAPGASFLFALPALFAALGAILALQPVRWAAWSVTALTLGALVSAALLPALARNLFNGVGLAFGGAGAACVAFFGLFLLPLVELMLPAPGVRSRATVAVPVTAAVLAVILAGTGSLVDRFDVRHPGRSHLAYVLNADTGAAGWVSGESEPTEWTRTYVAGKDVSRLSPGYARGSLWTGRAEPLALDGPTIEVRGRDGDSVTMHVTPRRSASSMVLRIDHPIDRAAATVAGMRPVSVAVSGVRAETWPGEIRFRDIPPEGADITVRTPGATRIRVTAIEETHGLAAAPGFRPRPGSLVASTREDGDSIAVTRTYEL
ncbi:M28 family peptidase [Nocardia vermiculata]|uniref:M28 family peptidase n=1 Tax=Nocardia vermiculata TaxID=257274 RepID=A0A846Y134_9NOCA|nr:M28 family peptidase [Nocardia vermiculata]NKY51762.1 M28 family peptidase [Nocardia vermiculata]